MADTKDNESLAEANSLDKIARAEEERRKTDEWRAEEQKELERELEEDRRKAAREVFAGGPPPETPIRGQRGGQGSPPSAPTGVTITQPVEVRLGRTQTERTADEILWILIREAGHRISFGKYREFMQRYMEHTQPRGPSKAALPFSHVNAYGLLKSGTETFLETHCGIVPPWPPRKDGSEPPFRTERSHGHFDRYTPDELAEMWRNYTRQEHSANGGEVRLLPYLDIIRHKLGEYRIEMEGTVGNLQVLARLIEERLVNPPMVELIWSYWHEEGMLAQTMAVIARRFQNVRGAGRDPLASLELDPLRPLNNILWGYLQDEQHRLNVMRRAYEYDHHYGITLHGKAIKNFRPADSRSRFLEAFHNLLHLTNEFYQRDDDTTVVADGFPLLAALKEVHLLLTQGGHNQYGDLPWTARQEMLMEQWILARPEMREFIGGRIMVAYPEAWMDRVDSMKGLQGWDNASSVHFRDLAAFGEQILLSIRYGAWVEAIDPNQAANWGRFWRAEIQGYLHAYRAVTGVDLRADATDARPFAERNLPPSVHLRNRLAAQGRSR